MSKDDCKYIPHPANATKVASASFNAIGVLADAAAVLSGENVDDPMHMAERCMSAIKYLAEAMEQ